MRRRAASTSSSGCFGRGYTLSYEPNAIVWREHPAQRGARRRQIYRYGIGLGAIISKRLIAGPERREPGCEAMPAAVRYSRDPAPRTARRHAEQAPASSQVAHAARDAARPVRLSLERVPGAGAPVAGQAVVEPARRFGSCDGWSWAEETINVVWFDDSPEARTRFSWRSTRRSRGGRSLRARPGGRHRAATLPATTDRRGATHQRGRPGSQCRALDRVVPVRDPRRTIPPRSSSWTVAPRIVRWSSPGPGSTR